jgi:DNA (cytosine-5)-methyltransferase 1
MKYLSVCSGIEAASVAWEPLGWEPVAFSEIEPFPCALLQHHYPTVPNLGDMEKFNDWTIPAFVILVGGTPCASFSVAGLRKGLADPRGNLALIYLGVVDKFRPRWVVWENVPGVLSSARGRDFGTFLGALGELGYGFAYRVLDAQFFGVAQRRRRVFVVAHLGDWQRAAEVLFEPEGVRRDSAKGRAKKQSVAPDARSGVEVVDLPRTVGTICADTHPGSYSGQDAYTGRLIPCASAFSVAENQRAEVRLSGTTPALSCSGGKPGQGYPAVLTGDLAAIYSIGMDSGSTYARDLAQPITRRNGDPGAVVRDLAVRRLTPVECERLQGFPDHWTAISYRGKPAADGPRYKALGNSMAVPVVRWIGERIAAVDASMPPVSGR